MRRLMLSPGEDLYIEVHGTLTYDDMLKAGWIEVTDDPVHEKLYQLQKAQQ